MAQGMLTSLLQYLRGAAAAANNRDLTDSELLERFRSHGEQAAFTVLVQRHGPMVLAVCRRVLGNVADAEDAFQATFSILVRKAGSVRNKASLGSWLYGVALRVAARARAQAVTRRERERHAADTLRAERRDDVTLNELHAILDEEVGALPEKYRAPVVLCYLEGKSYDQAARELGWPKSSLASRLAQAREHLRKRLKRRGICLSAAALVTALGERVAAGAVPALLVIDTVKAAALIVAGKSAAGECFSAQAISLAEEPMNGILGVKGKVVLALLALSLVVGGVGLAGHQTPSQKPRAPRVGEARTPAANARASVNAQHDPGRDAFGDPLPPGARARLGSVRFRYSGWVERLSFSPDGTRLACAGSNGVRVWEAASGRPAGSFEGRADAVTFLAGGQRIAAGGKELILWETANGKEVARLPIKGGLLHSAYSSDGKLLAGVGSDGALRLVDAATGAVLHKLDGHEDRINQRPKGAAPSVGQILSVAFAPDGKSLASACFQDRRIFVWDVATGKVLRMLAGHDRPYVVQFSPDGGLLAVGGCDCLIHLWDMATGRKVKQLSGHIGDIFALAFAPDGRTLASGARGSPPDTKDGGATDSTVRLWDLKTGKARTLPGPKQWTQAVAFTPDGKTLAAGGSGNTIHLIDLATGKEKHAQVGHNGRIFCVALSPNGSVLATGGEDNLIHLWNAKTGRETARLKGHQGHVSGLAFTPDGRELVSCSYDGTVRVWDPQHSQEVRCFARTGGWHYGFDLAPDGRTLLLPTGQLWNVATGKQTGAIPDYQGLQYRGVFSPDGKKIAAPHGAIATVKDVSTGRTVCHFAGHEPATNDRRGNNAAHVECVAFSPDGRRIASGGIEGLAFIWDAATGKMLRRLKGHENPIIAIAFSPDGRSVATGSGSIWNHKEQTVRLWEAATGKERCRFVGHQAQVTSLVFSRDGSSLISASEDGTALVWDVRGVRAPESHK